jgi:hypothetical protein
MGTRQPSSHDSRDLRHHQRAARSQSKTAIPFVSYVDEEVKIAVENRDPLGKLRDKKVKMAWESHDNGLHSGRPGIKIPVIQSGRIVHRQSDK